jgi:hypothetical protein
MHYWTVRAATRVYSEVDAGNAKACMRTMTAAAQGPGTRWRGAEAASTLLATGWIRGRTVRVTP